VTRGRVRLALGLALPAAIVGWLHAAPPGAALRAGLVTLDFDPDRAALVAAWLACLALAALAGAATGRPWPSAAAATLCFVAAHAVPWAWRAASAPPVILGSVERLSPPALAGQVLAMTAVALLVAIPAAAGASLVGAAAADLRRRPGRALAAILAVGVAAGAALAGAGSLVRYGPAHGVFAPVAAGPVPAGRVLNRTFASAAMRTERPYSLYLPAAYDRQPDRRFPVVYLLHGEPGGYRDWLNLGLARLLDQGIAAGSLPPLIAVLPDGNGAVTPAAQWANAWDGSDRVEDSILELAVLVDREERTLPDRRHRVVGGLSEGGFGAANLAARHPDVFGVAISLSGYFTAEGPVFGANAAYQRANSPTDAVRKPGQARSVLYLLAVGEQDPRYLGAAQRFSSELDRQGVRHQLFLLPGGHEGDVWTSGLVLCLQHVKTQLEAA
jgi:enterochelin esterase-like enzyme